ncbi:hypothetical protein PIGHUM_02332 [Pigmentiphaga humi]|uniref:ACT domain-containing protein n=1 Tax=Pigmentiphaga humi TaxID=2478468 RepID=A0A3P4B527_9BURK|nr:hypothetical protein [Pigmentiphaga humi]VCU70265.1 hypothetical protein PIGHUM_02332 [Pigmentiphaga humi]
MRFARFFGVWSGGFRRGANQYRLTVFSTEPRLDRLRQHLHAELSRHDLRISQIRVACAGGLHPDHRMSVTLDCPPGRRAALNALALGLGRHPAIHRVQYERLH